MIKEKKSEVSEEMFIPLSWAQIGSRSAENATATALEAERLLATSVGAELRESAVYALAHDYAQRWIVTKRRNDQTRADTMQREQQRKAGVLAAQEDWRSTSTKGLVDSLEFWLHRYPEGTWRAGPPCFENDASPYLVRQDAPQVRPDNVPRVATWFGKSENRTCLLFTIPATIGASALIVNFDAEELWGKIAKRYSVAPTLTWFCEGTARHVFLFKGKAPEMVIVPGIQIIHRGYVSAPIANDTIITKWETDPATFGKSLSGDAIDIPPLPAEFLAKLAETATTSPKFRETWFSMMLSNAA